MKHIKQIDLNEANLYKNDVSTAISGSADAVVVYFDHDVKGEFGKAVKKIIDECALETVSIKGNILTVSEGEGPRGGIKKFKKILGLN